MMLFYFSIYTPKNNLAERKGFEPSIPMQLEYTLSKRAPSTTRPPLYNLQSNKVKNYLFFKINYFLIFKFSVLKTCNTFSVVLAATSSKESW